MENTSVHWCNKLPIKPPVTHIILSFIPHRQHPGAVYLQFWERAEEGGSGHPSPAESRTHPGALQWQHPQESQHQVSHQLRHLARVVSLYVLKSQWNSQFRAFFYLNILQTVFINCPKSSVKCPLILLDLRKLRNFLKQLITVVGNKTFVRDYFQRWTNPRLVLRWVCRAQSVNNQTVHQTTQEKKIYHSVIQFVLFWSLFSDDKRTNIEHHQILTLVSSGGYIKN